MTDVPLRILLVADNGAAACDAASVLNRDSRLDVTWFPDLADGAVAFRRDRFDAAIMAHLGPLHNFESLHRLQEAAPWLPILLLMDETDHDGSVAREACRHGAQDCIFAQRLDRDDACRRLMAAIERKRLEQHRIRNARQDEVTGLANHLLLDERFQRAVTRADRQQTLIGLVTLQIDRFDEMTAGFGLATRDELLRQIAMRLCAIMRPTDTLARSRQAGFAWLVEDLSDIDQIGELIDRIPAALAPAFLIGQAVFEVTVSAGVAVSPFHGRRFCDLLSLAEAAMLDVTTMSGDGMLMPPLPVSLERTSLSLYIS